MIGHLAFSLSFRDLADYLEAGTDGMKRGRIEWLEARNVWAPSVADAAAVMAAIAASSTCRSPVLHLSVAFRPSDPVDQSVMCRVADRLLSDLHLTEHHCVIVAHNDREHPHFHLMVNRVHPRSGRVWKIDFSKREVEKSLREQERELGLAENPGHLYRLPGQAAPDRSRSVGAGVLRREERTGERAFVVIAREQVAVHFAEATSFNDLDRRLAERGYHLEARTRGLVVTDGNGFAAVSAVSNDASRNKLERRFGETYETYRVQRGPERSGSDRPRGSAPGRRGGRDELQPLPGRGDAIDPAETTTTTAGRFAEATAGAATPGGTGGGGCAGPDGEHHRPARSTADRGRGADPGLGQRGGGNGDSQDDGAPRRAGAGDGRAPGGFAPPDPSVHGPGGSAVQSGSGSGGEQQLPYAGDPGGRRGKAGQPDQADGDAAEGTAQTRGGSIGADRRPRAGALERGPAAEPGLGVAAVDDGDVHGVRASRPPDGAQARMDDERGAAPRVEGRRSSDLHVLLGDGGRAERDAEDHALENARAPGLDGGTAGSKPPMIEEPVRFSLYDEEGVYGVLDEVGPQVFFAESRQQAVAEVARANEIVVRYPTTMAMLHLYEMDAAWREARGLPRLPHPQGRPVVVQDWLRPRSEEHAPPAPAVPAAVQEAIGAARAAAAGLAAREESARTQAAVERTVELSSQLVRAAAEARDPLRQLRTGLEPVYADRAPDAESGFRAAAQRLGTSAAIRLLRDDPRSLLPEPKPLTLPGGIRSRAAAAEIAAETAPPIARLDRLLQEVATHAGERPVPADASAAARRLTEILPVQQAAAAESRARLRDAGSQDGEAARLLAIWPDLTPAEQQIVRHSVPQVDAVLANHTHTRTPPGPEI